MTEKHKVLTQIAILPAFPILFFWGPQPELIYMGIVLAISGVLDFILGVRNGA